MDVQVRVDDWPEKSPDNSDEVREISVIVVCFWPSTATQAEIEGTLSLACDNTRTAVKRKREEAA